MRMLKEQLFLFLIIYIRDSSGVIDDLFNAGEQVWKFYSMLNDINVNSGENIGTLEELLRGDTETNRKIKEQMNEIHEQLDAIENFMNPKISNDSIKLFSSSIMLTRCLDTFEIFMKSIDGDYKEFHDLISTDDYFDNRQSQYLAESIILSAEAKIYVLRKIMIDAKETLPNDKNLPLAIASYVIIWREQICGTQIISEILIQLFRVTIIAEIKVNVLLSLANFHRSTDNEGWKSINSLARQQFDSYFAMYVDTLTMILNLINGLYIRACDPDNGAWIQNENYYELEGILQPTIIHYNWAKCMLANCNTVWHNQPNHCDSKFYDERSGCSGTIGQCISLGTTQACVLKTGSRKYQYVNSTVLGLLGKNFDCNNTDGYTIDIGSGWSYMRSACSCHCYRHHNKISLRIIESKVEYNMVITGLRFIRKNNILYIQPEEGKLMANGFIDQYTRRWIPIPTNIEASQLHSIDRINRFFFLDDTHLPANFVLTGIKFNKVTRGNITGFAISISGVSFNYTSGQLDGENKMSMYPQVSKELSGERLLFERISSVHTKLRHEPSPGNLKYVKLRQSSLRDDYGQSMLPLFDAVPVTTNPQSALGGIGIFHKVVNGYAGFISLRAYGIQYVEYFTNFKIARMRHGRVLFNYQQIN